MRRFSAMLFGLGAVGILAVSELRAAPVEVSLASVVDSDLFSDVPGKDAVCLRSSSNPKGRAAVEVPVGHAGEALLLRWWLREPQASGPGAMVKVELADGTRIEAVAVVGEAMSQPPVATGRSFVVPLGQDLATGQPREGNLWILPIARDVEVKRVSIHARATATLCVAGVAVGPSPLSLSPRPLADSAPYVLERWLSPLPSSLPVEAPAGRRGPVRLDLDGHFVYGDGTRARFWGINLVSAGAIPERSEADAFAATLAGLGFNLVRVHHIDHRAPLGVLAPDRELGGSPFDVDRLDRLDYFVSRLLAHGLYLWLEVATAREFTAADGVLIPDPVPSGHKFAPMWEPDRADAYERWFEQLWGRENPYTGKKYAEEPGVAMLELSNEHELTSLWGFGLEQLPPAHLAALDQRWNDWLKERYVDEAALVAAWTGGVFPGLAPGESLPAGSVRREPVASQLAGRWPRTRRDDLLAFYAEIQDAWYTRVARKARAMGFTAPVIPPFQYNRPYVQAAVAPLTSRWAKEGIDARISDIHIALNKSADGETEARSSLEAPASLLSFLPAQVAGTAACVGELNHTFPNPFRAEAAPLFAALAAVQDWDALVWIPWSDGPVLDDGPTRAGAGELRSSYTLLAHLPAASAAFRAGTIQPAPGYFPISVDPEGALLADPSKGARPWEVLDPAFVLGNRVRTAVSEVPVSPIPGEPDGSVGWWPGHLVVDRPGYQVRVGGPGAPVGQGVGPLEPSGLRVALDRWAVVSFAHDAGGALLAVSARQENTGIVTVSQGRYRASDGTAPIRLGGVKGTVSFPWKGRPKVFLLDTGGREGQAIPVVPDGKGWWKLTLDGVVGLWFRVR